MPPVVWSLGPPVEKVAPVEDAMKAVESHLRARYGLDVIADDGLHVTLSDGSEMFLTSLYAELALASAKDWPIVIDDWFTMLDLLRARIADTG